MPDFGGWGSKIGGTWTRPSRRAQRDRSEVQTGQTVVTEGRRGCWSATMIFGEQRVRGTGRL